MSMMKKKLRENLFSESKILLLFFVTNSSQFQWRFLSPLSHSLTAMMRKISLKREEKTACCCCIFKMWISVPSTMEVESAAWIFRLLKHFEEVGRSHGRSIRNDVSYFDDGIFRVKPWDTQDFIFYLKFSFIFFCMLCWPIKKMKK